jgi:XTP/dITP diphosphohydrolase
MRRLVVATRNPGKAREIRDLLGPLGFDVETLSDLPEFEGLSVEETGTTFEANALIKAQWAAEITSRAVVADDSGLVVDALDGAPGVHSSRYAGTDGDDVANNRKLVAALAGVPPERRGARFVCAAVLFVPAGGDGRFARWVEEAGPGRLEEAPDGQPVALDGGVAVVWRGEIAGRIIDEPRGPGGFGYDPHFLVPELGLTTAELPADEKNAISHRGQAFAKLAKAFARLTDLASKR